MASASSTVTCKEDSQVQRSSESSRRIPTSAFLHVLKELSVIRVTHPQRAVGTILGFLSNSELSAFARTCCQMALYSKEHCSGRAARQPIDRAVSALPLESIVGRVNSMAQTMREGSAHQMDVENQKAIVQRVSSSESNIFVYLLDRMNNVQGTWKRIELCFDVNRRQVAVVGMDQRKKLEVDVKSISCLRDCTNVLVPYEFINCYDLFLESRVTMISKWCSGGDLRSILYSSSSISSLTADLRKRFIYDIAHGLSDIHKKGLCHGDLKPENIVAEMDNDKPRLMIIDLDSVRPLGGSYVSMGTPGYIAPERWDRDEKMHPSADIFSFGIILYEIWAGAPKCFHFEQGALLRRMRQFDPTEKQMCDLFPKVKPGQSLFSLMQSMLQRDPLKRPSITNVLKQIHDIFPS